MKTILLIACLVMLSASTEENIQSLIAQLESKDASVRRNAALELGRIGEAAKDAVPALMKALNDKEWTVRVSVVNALGDIGESAKDAVSALIKALGDENWQVRYWSIDALRRISIDETAKNVILALAKVLSDNDHRVRLSAADVLGNIGKAAKEAVPALIKALSDKEHRVRANVASALGKMGESAKEAIPELTKALKDEEPQVRENAAIALRQISIPASITPGAEVRIETPKTASYILVYVPEDYAPNRVWPIIFCYHGYGGKPTTWPFKQATNGKGFIIVGIEYATKEYGIHPRLNNVEPEKMQFDEALATVSSLLKVDSKMIFMGGFSQGGYSTSVLGEHLLDRVAGLIILGAGRTMVDGYPPPNREGNSMRFREKLTYLVIGGVLVIIGRKRPAT